MRIYSELFEKVNSFFEDMDCEDCYYDDDYDDCDRDCCGTWMLHTFHVFTLCSTFVNLLNNNVVKVDKKILLISSILHDIAKPIDNDDHNYREYLYEAFNEAEITFDDKYINNICSLIESHKSKHFNPPPNLAFEAAVLRICDKLDKYRKGSSKAYKKCSNSIELMEDYFYENNLQREWREFEKVYDVMEELISL